jgi:Mg-chelatase subunit ChlD
MTKFVPSDDKLIKWRLILGKDAQNSPEKASAEGGDGADAIVQLTPEQIGMDKTLEALYAQHAERTGGLVGSSPNVNRWLGDIRTYFPSPMVQIMQRDALDRLHLNQMLTQAELLESLVPDVHLVATLLALNEAIPDETRHTARLVVQKVVEDIEKRLSQSLREAVRGALSRAVRNRRPRYTEIDWQKTIRANLKNYQPTLQTIIPDQFIGRGRRGQSLRHIILLVDQSGSMATSVVYASIFGAVLASLRSLQTHFIVFDTDIADLTAHLHEPIDLLFGTQLGGGTDIGKALSYAEGLITSPNDTILILISDLFEGGNNALFLARAAALKESGVQVISLLALSDDGKPAYDKTNAKHLAEKDIPCFACTPDKFADLIAAAIERREFDL